MEFLIDEEEPTELAVTVEEMKIFSRVDGDDEDELIEQLIRGVTQEAEDICHRAFTLRRVFFTADLPAGGDIVLPVLPVSGVASVKVDGEEVDSELYSVSMPSSQGRRIRPAVIRPLDGFPEEGTIVIEAFAGGGVPEPVVTWIKTRVSSLYEQRESHAMFNTGLKFTELGRDYALALLDPYIVHGGF